MLLKVFLFGVELSEFSCYLFQNWPAVFNEDKESVRLNFDVNASVYVSPLYWVTGSGGNYFLAGIMIPPLLFFCPVGGWTPVSARSRCCMTTWQRWATQSLYECSRQQPTQTSAVWSVSTVVSTDPQGPSSPIFTVICCCSVASSRRKTDQRA